MKTEGSGQRTEDNGQRTTDRGQRTEDNGQGAEDIGCMRMRLEGEAVVVLFFFQTFEEVNRNVIPAK